MTFTIQNVASGNGDIRVLDLNGDYLDDMFTPSSNNLQVHYQTETGFNLAYIPVSTAS